MTTPELPADVPAESYPIAVYVDTTPLLPGRIGVTEDKDTITLDVAALRLATFRNANDARLKAARDTANQISRAAGRYADLLQMELHERERQHQADLARTAAQAAERAHPYPNGHEQIVQVDTETARTLLGPVEPADEVCQTLTLPQFEETADVVQ